MATILNRRSLSGVFRQNVFVFFNFDEVYGENCSPQIFLSPDSLNLQKHLNLVWRKSVRKKTKKEDFSFHFVQGFEISAKDSCLYTF